MGMFIMSTFFRKYFSTGLFFVLSRKDEGLNIGMWKYTTLRFWIQNFLGFWQSWIFTTNIKKVSLISFYLAVGVTILQATVVHPSHSSLQRYTLSFDLGGIFQMSTVECSIFLFFSRCFFVKYLGF